MNLQSTWQTTSHKVLSSILGDEGAIIEVMDLLTKPSLFPPKDQPIWAAIQHCLKQNIPPTISMIEPYLNGQSGYAQVVASQFNAEDNEQIYHHARQLIKISQVIKVQEAGRKLQSVNLETIDEVLDEVSGNINSLSLPTERDPSAKSIDQELWSKISEGSYTVVPTGIDWIDRQLFGLWTGRNHWFVAPYKSRKTSLARNMVVHAAMQGFPVSFFAGEGQRDTFVLDCQVMLAVKKMLEDDPARFHNIRLSSDKVLLSPKHPLSAEENEAMQYGRSLFSALPIYIYDQKDQITNLNTLTRLVRRDKLERGVVSFWVDYSQLFGQGNIYDRQSTFALEFQALCAREDVAGCAISQKNEEGVKAKRDNYSPNVKGGGDAPAAADILFVTRTDAEYDDRFYIELKLGRRAGQNTQMHRVHPSSGLICDFLFDQRIPF